MRGRPPFALRHPRGVLISAAVAIAILAVFGWGVDDELRPTSLRAPGTESARGSDLQQRYFGHSAPFAILLRGPAGALDVQGPRLIRALRRDSAVTTVSPWDRGEVLRLRPSPEKALILADFHVDPEEAVRKTVPQLEQALGEQISPPVRATQTGFASLSRAIQEESVDSTHRAELIAIPFLLLVLLLVFRSPISAAIPLVFGAVTVIASRGVLSLAAGSIPIDGFALTVCTMMGLALGVDYALLMVSRFREELEAGSAPLQAAWTTRRTAGRTTLFAGSTLFVSMLVTLFVMPGTLLISLAGTAIAVTAISVLVATVIGPALLVVLGRGIDRWHIAAAGNGGAISVVGAVLARPRLVAIAIGGVLLLLCLPVLALQTGPPSAEQLPSDDPARVDAETVSAAIGPGWDVPFVVVAVSDRGPITSRDRLAALGDLQRTIASDPGVQAVTGPGQVEKRVAPLQRAGNDLLAGRGNADPERLQRLGQSLGRAAGGVRQLREGISKAAYGAGLLAEGSGRGEDGADQIAGGVERVSAGAERAVGALQRLDRGSGQLAEGQREAALAGESLKFRLTDFLPSLRREGLARARRLRAELRARVAGDPSLGPQLRQSERLVEVLAIFRNEVREMRGLAGRLHSGQARLAEGGATLHEGTGRLADAATDLPPGLDRLAGGAARLVDGLDRLEGGAETLGDRLAQGFQGSRPLQTGLRRADVRVSAEAAAANRKVEGLRRSSPALFDSGYFVLSALDGAPRERRERAGQVVDLGHGGQAVQMVVVPRSTFNTPASAALNERLKRDASQFEDRTPGIVTAVTGGAAELTDYDEAIGSRIPIVIAVITVATFLVLVLVLRAIPLAAIAVLLNLVTVAVAFGVLTLLFEVPDGWPLGGRTYVDAIGAAGIFGIVFGLSIDYAVFLLMRMRESYENGASNQEAIAFGLERTAGVITGAAAIMMAVFVAFAGAPIATVSQLGIGLTVAVLLDATVIRILLLPALMLVVGDRVWWLPRSLDRILPRIDLHGARPG